MTLLITLFCIAVYLLIAITACKVWFFKAKSIGDFEEADIFLN